MTFVAQAQYFADRAVRHADMAERATNRAARAAHLELGERYAAKAAAHEVDSKSPPIG